MASKDIQTNFRLPREKHEVLEAAAYVEEAGSVQKLVKQIVEEAIQHYASLPTVQMAREAREEQLAKKAGKVSSLPARQRRVVRDSG